jgi:GT2 family glycosyltransferase
VLICSKDRRHYVERLALNLTKINSKYDKEIVIVEETDHPKNIPGVTYIPHPVRCKGIAAARNLALTHARSEIVVFLDDDCEVSDRWLDQLLEPFDDQSIVGVQGGVSVTLPTNAIGWAESILGFPGGGIKRIIEANGANVETKEISTLNCSYRRKVIDLVGGFDEMLLHGGEDYVFAKQAINYGKCIFVPSAIANHKPRESLRKIWSWFVRRGKAEVKVIQSHKYEKATYKSMIRGSLTIKFLFLILAGIFIPDYRLIFFGMAILLYGISTYARYYKIWRSSSAMISAFFALPVVKIAMDLATDLGRLKALIHFEK